MVYTPFDWSDGAAGGTPITAARLDALEAGVAGMQDDLQFIVLTEAPYNADPTGVTAIDTALDNALTALGTNGPADPTGASARHGGVIYLPPGYYKLAAAHTISKNSIVIRGAGRQATKLFCDTSFPTSTPVFNISGASGGTVFDSRLESLTLNCNGVVGSIGVKTVNAQEGCGLRGVRVRDFRDRGFWAVGTGETSKPAELVIEDCEFWASSAMATGYGLYFDDTVQVVYVRDCTILTLAASSGGTAAIYLTEGSLHVENIHIEDFPDGIIVDTDGVLFADTVSAINGPGGSAGHGTIQLPSTSNKCSAHNVHNGTGNVIYDARAGVTLGGAGQRNIHSYVVDYGNDDVITTRTGPATFRKSRGSTQPAIVATDGTSTTASLQQWQNSASTVKAEMFASGLLRLGETANSTTNWSDGHLILGPYHVFVDANGLLRVKNGTPASATDGTPVGDPSIPLPAVNHYFFPLGQGSASTSNTLGNGTLRLYPWIVTRSCTLDRLGGDITVIGDAASTVRLGIYADNGSFYPGSLVLDAGTISGNSATLQTITISQALSPGVYWIGGAVQGVTTTQPTVRTMASQTFQPMGLGTSVSTGATVIGYQESSVTGALPSTFSSTVTTSGGGPRIHVRRSA